jgi:hypothetical protein
LLCKDDIEERRSRKERDKLMEERRGQDLGQERGGRRVKIM